MPVGEVLIGSGLVAAGAVITLDRLRRAQHRHRHAGRTIPVPTGLAADAELAIRRRAFDAPTDRLDAALRALAACLAGAGDQQSPAIDAVTVGPDLIEILLAEPVSAPAGPFEVTADGRAWTLVGADITAEVADLAARQCNPAPALVVVGTIDDRQVLIDLEQQPRTAICGDPDQRKELWSGLALNLATSTWADDLRVVVIGTPPAGIAALERVHVVDSFIDFIEDLEPEARAMTAALSRLKCGSTVEARVRGVGDGWPPTVVLVADRVDEEEAARLRELASAQTGVAVVTFQDPAAEADRELRLDEDHLAVRPPGLDVRPIAISADAELAVAKLIELAASDEPGNEVVPADEGALSAQGSSVIEFPESTKNPEHGVTVDASASSAHLRRSNVTVHLIGSVEIEGAKTPIDRRRCRELIVYLALHPDGVDEGRIKAALWPNKAPTDGAFNQTVSIARTCLGLDENGDPHLPYVSERLYRTGPGVRTSVDVIRDAFRRATAESSAEAMERLAQALGAVRGLPFEGERGGFEWAYSEGHVAALTAIVSDAAHLLAQWSLDHGDPSSAVRAASQGLKAVPADEVLYRDRMLAHDKAGDPAGVDADMDELCRVIETVEPYDSLHPETLALYEQLSRHRRRLREEPPRAGVG